MRLVERMTNPPKCLGCGQGNIEDEHREVGPFVDLQVDVNWGDDAYLCPLCVEKIAALCGFVDKEELDDLKEELEDQRKRAHDAEALRDEAIARAKRIAGAVRVVRNKGKEKVA